MLVTRLEGPEVIQPRNRHERRKQVAEARRLGHQIDLLRQPSATVLRSEMQARVEREWRMNSELWQRILGAREPAGSPTTEDARR